MASRDKRPDPRPHGVPDQDGLLDAEVVQQRDDIVTVRPHPVGRADLPGTGPTAQVEADSIAVFMPEGGRA